MLMNVYSCFFMHVYLINSRTNFKTMLTVVSSRTKYMYIQWNPDFSNLLGQENENNCARNQGLKTEGCETIFGSSYREFQSKV